MTTTTPTTGPARSEAYEYGRTGQPFCPPPPGGLAAYEEAAWVADFHAGREDREAASAAITSGPVSADTADYLADKRQQRKEEEAARRNRAHLAAEAAKEEARIARRKEDGDIRGYEDGLAGVNSPARTKGVDFSAYSKAHDRGRREAEQLAADNRPAYEWGYKAGQKHAALGEAAANPFVRRTAAYCGYQRGYDRQVWEQAQEGQQAAVACENEAYQARVAADRNAAWKANMNAAAGIVRAEDLRLDAVNGWGEPLETDTDDRGDRVAVNEFRQAVAADNQAAQDAGYRDGYYNAVPERRIFPEGENLHYDHGIALGRAGKDGRPENRFSRQS